MAFNEDGDVTREPNLYEELSKFVSMLHDRLDWEREQADALESQAKFARRQASETMTVYETISKLHDSMANKPADMNPSTVTYTVPFDSKQYRIT